MENNLIYVVVKPSAFESRDCVLGQGDSPKEAWEDAYGPKPWSVYVKKSAKGAWVRRVTRDELDELNAQ
jgi:hypothetical protein